MTPRRLRVDALYLGVAGGLVLLILLLRLNPDAQDQGGSLALAAPLWAVWGVLTIGTTCLLAALAVRRLRPQAERARCWPAPELAFAMYVVAAVTCRVNADLHPEFLSGTGHRTLGQDAVAWLISGLIALGIGVWVRRRGATRRGVALFAAVVVLLPVLRFATEPTPRGNTEPEPVRFLGQSDRPLIVLGIEGLDPAVLGQVADNRRYPALDGLLQRGSWGAVDAYRPYLRLSLWTSLATGAYPSRHGLRSRSRWEIAAAGHLSLQLLPWTPLGSGWVVPWGLTRRRAPQPSALPPLWDLLRASGVPTRVWDWPGVWPEGSVEHRTAWPSAATVLDPVLYSSLDAALTPFPEARRDILRAVDADVGRMAELQHALAGGTRCAWVHLGAFAETRRALEPLSSQDSLQRAAWDLLLELVDDRVGDLLDNLPRDALVVVVSPYGFDAPGPFERLLRLLGLGGGWRATAAGSPDGAVILVGRGVVPDHLMQRVMLPDVAPTLCYLVGLPVTQSMEGRVILDAVEPDFLAEHPLQVVD